ncbi:Tripartite tricarboxylate transporter family receptor [compost metagenome]
MAKVFIDGNKLKPLAVAAAQRYPATPDVATFREQGMADFELAGWTAVFVPAGTPAPVAEMLNAAVRKSLASPESVQLRASNGTQPLAFTLEESRRFAKEEIARWARYVKNSGVKPE